MGPALLATFVISTAWLAGVDSASEIQNTVTAGPAQMLREYMMCPPASVSLPLLARRCKTDNDCESSQLCCNVDGKIRCRKAVPRPTRQPFLGLPRECPEPPVTELLPVKNCTQDSDCWPRICCPEGLLSYCRTSLPYTEESKDFNRLRSMVSYFQCTPPPPPVLDFFPKPCRSPIDCIPNLCCQEQGKKVCRPPRKSVIALLFNILKRFG